MHASTYEHVWYDELTLQGVTYDRNSYTMKQEFWFLLKLYKRNFPSDDHCVTRKSWFQDASGKACYDANQSIGSIHPKGKF